MGTNQVMSESATLFSSRLLSTVSLSELSMFSINSGRFAICLIQILLVNRDAKTA